MMRIGRMENIALTPWPLTRVLRKLAAQGKKKGASVKKSSGARIFAGQVELYEVISEIAEENEDTSIGKLLRVMGRIQ